MVGANTVGGYGMAWQRKEPEQAWHSTTRHTGSIYRLPLSTILPHPATTVTLIPKPLASSKDPTGGKRRQKIPNFRAPVSWASECDLINPITFILFFSVGGGVSFAKYARRKRPAQRRREACAEAATRGSSFQGPSRAHITEGLLTLKFEKATKLLS